MKSILIFVLVILAGISTMAQLKISPGATIKTSGGVTVVLQDLDLVNDGTINQSSGDGGFKFSGVQNSAIKGINMPVIGILELNKSGGTGLLLNQQLSINSSINFISGQLDLNGNNILMATNANIAGETETNRVIGPSGGFIEITQNMNAPNGSNPGNLGAFITSPANLGAVTLRRGHTSQSGTGLSSGIYRYYSISPVNNNGLTATLRLRYFDAELNGQNEDALVIYQSNDAGTNWSNFSKSGNNTNSNYVEQSGLSSLALQTLANNNVLQQDGVTGLVFTGIRKKSNEVQLNWTTQTETNISGYEVQRRLDNEADFSVKGYVNSSTPGGNSLSPLSYQYKDANAHTGDSYYRLKIITLNNTFTYSDEILVATKTKGTGGGGNGGGGNGNGGGNPHNAKTQESSPMADTETGKLITIGPNPNNGNFWFRIHGLKEETIASLFTIDGKLISQFRIQNMQQQSVSGLNSGIYLLKIPGLETQKVIVNSNGKNGNIPFQKNHLNKL